MKTQLRKSELELFKRFQSQGFNVTQEEELCLILGKIIRERSLEDKWILEAVNASNPEKKRGGWFKPRKWIGGATYACDFYSLAEVGIAYFESDRQHLIELFDSIPNRQTIMKGQLIYCLSCMRDPSNQRFFEKIADSKDCEYLVNNSLYGIAYLDKRERYSYVLEFLLWRKKAFAAFHIVYQWTDSLEKANALYEVFMKIEDEVKIRILKEVLAKFGLVQTKIPSKSIFTQGLPPGLVRPDSFRLQL